MPEIPILLPSWKATVIKPWSLVIALAIVFACMRAAGILGTANLRWMLPLGFVLMAALPWMVLTPEGRGEIGLKKPGRAWSYIPAILLGAVAASICFALGFALFDTGADNWFVSIASNYRQIMDTTGFGLLQLHLIFTIPALLFSPVGEEIFFRGLLQRALEEKLSLRSSTLIECAFFGLVHLCHHGLVMGSAGLRLLPLSGGIWVLLMFLAALLFASLKRHSGSLYTAMASHAAFNLTMNLFIFSVLWQRF
jgi:uncharacterized protein